MKFEGTQFLWHSLLVKNLILLGGPSKKKLLLRVVCGGDHGGTPFFLQVRFYVDCLAGGKKCGKKATPKVRGDSLCLVPLTFSCFVYRDLTWPVFFAAQACDRSFADTLILHWKPFPYHVSLVEFRWVKPEKLEILKPTLLEDGWQPNEWWFFGGAGVAPQKWQTHFKWTSNSFGHPKAGRNNGEWSLGRLGQIDSCEVDFD